MIEQLRGQNWSTTNLDGLVVDNNDPLKAGRVRVRVAGIHDGVKDEHLPWAVNGNISGRGPNKAAASVRIPTKGSRVLLTFQQGDPTNPMFYGGVTSASTIPEVFKQNYPNRNGEAFPNGTHWYLDEQSNTFFFSHAGFTVTIDSAGNATINSGSVNWAASGNYTTSSPQITNDSPNTNMTGQTNSAALITGAGGMAISGGSGASVDGNVRVNGNMNVYGGDVTADAHSLKMHKHTGDSGGMTSSAIP